MKIKIAKTILSLQALFTVPVYFSVLTSHPVLWFSMLIAVLPLGVRFWYTRHIIKLTLFDIPILIFVCAMLLGLIVSPDKGLAIGTLCSAIASILVYYGITDNSGSSRKYWFWTTGIISAITLLLSLWFLSQGQHRVLSFNYWAFNLLAGLPKSSGPILNLNTIGALLAVVVPPLWVIVFLKNNIIVRIIVITLCLFLTGVLFISDSGAGWLAVIVSMTFIVIYWQKWLVWVLIPLEGLLMGTAALFYNKLEWLRTTFSTSSFMSRITLWRNTLALLKGKTVVLGLGPGAWLGVYSKHYPTTVAIVHNSYLQLYCDAGILGFVAMVWAAVIFIRFSIKLLKSPRRNSGKWIGIGLIGSIIAGAVYAMFDTTHSITYVIDNGYIYLVLPLLWIGAALVSVINDKLSMSENRKPHKGKPVIYPSDKVKNDNI